MGNGSQRLIAIQSMFKHYSYNHISFYVNLI